MYINYVHFLLVFGIFPNICFCSDLYSVKVLNYDTNTFKRSIGGPKPHFVNFFAPWCGYCKRLKPVWDELAEKYNVESANQEIVIAKVDCTVQTPLCAEESISGYPSLMFYEAGEIKGTKYQGKRDLLGLEDYISTYLDSKGKPSKADHVTQTSQLQGHVLKLTDATFEKTVQYGLHFVKFFAPWCGHCQRMAGVWQDLAETHKEDKSLTISEVDCTENRKTCSDFEVKGYPTLLWIVNGKKMEKYQGNRELKDFKEFITKMKLTHEDLLDANYERVPDVDEKKPDVVVELSKNNFDDAVGQGLSFIKFYVPWCGHCKKLAPVWTELAAKLAPNAQVKIGKVDCTQEEELCGEHEIVGYPSLYLFRNGKMLTEYHGERKLENLYSYVLEHLQHSEL